MQFESGHLYHIYNQGNNRQKIFFCRDNYLFFLKKIHTHILPFADVLAWCLMPNHFHLMVYVNRVEVEAFTDGVTPSHPVSKSIAKPRNFNDSIGIMLRSYTRAINTEQNRTGALFREETKAINLSKINNLTSSWYINQGITTINIKPAENQYPNICFNYILKNPIKDGLVKSLDDWEFSSYHDTHGKRDGKLIHKQRVSEYGLQLMEPL